jgi:hypothetical protein
MTHITIKKEKLEQVLAALEKCKDALAEELAAWDIDPLLHHVLESHDLCIPAIAAVKAALAKPEERNFCPRCGKRTADLTAIHTCTPPQENT